MGVDGTYPLLMALWLLPLAGAIVCWAFGPQLKSVCGWLASGMLARIVRAGRPVLERRHAE